MRLACVYFDGMFPIPGTSERVASLHASDGWDLERDDAGIIRASTERPVDGGEVKRLAFSVERWPCAWVEAPAPKPVEVSRVVLEDVVPTKREPQKGKRR